MPINSKRILVKLSGESLKNRADSAPFCADNLARVASHLGQLKKLGYEIAVVLGGGNLWRGGAAACPLEDRVSADQIGMLATVMNGLSLMRFLEKEKVAARLFSGVPVPSVCESYRPASARQALAQGELAICVGGIGSPFFSTDTAAVVRAIELGCALLLKSTSVAGVYSADPKKDPTAVYLPRVTYEDYIQRDLKVMDLSSVVLARSHDLPLRVFSYLAPNSLLDALEGQATSSLICAQSYPVEE